MRDVQYGQVPESEVQHVRNPFFPRLIFAVKTMVNGGGGDGGAISNRKWSRATLQLFWLREHRSGKPALDFLRNGVFHRCGESHHSPITDTLETKFHQVEYQFLVRKLHRVAMGIVSHLFIPIAFFQKAQTP